MSEARHTAPPSRVSIWRHSDDDLEVYLEEWLGSTYYLRFLSGSSITRVVESGRWVQNGAGRVLESGHLLLVLRKFESTHDILFSGDVGICPYCNAAFEWVRPGKSQPVCDCQDTVVMRRWEIREIERVLMKTIKNLKKDLKRLKK